MRRTSGFACFCSAVLETAFAPPVIVPGPWSGSDDAFGRLTEDAFAPYPTLPDLPDLALVTRSHDPGTVAYFRAGGTHFLSSDDLDAVAKHTCAVVMQAPTTPLGARALLLTAAALLDAGGAGVRVDGAVKVMDKDRWRALAADEHPLAPYAALVQVLEDPRRGTHSLGMHYFGLPDVRLDTPLPPNVAFEAVHRLNQMQLAEPSSFADGLTLALDGQHALALHHERDTFASPGHPSFNPHGRWRVAPAS